MISSGRRLTSVLLAVCMCVAMLSGTLTVVDAISPGYTVSSAYKSSSYYSALSKVVLTGNQREDIVNVALSQVGYREGTYSGDYGGSDDGSYNNYTEYNYWYHNYVNSGMPVGGDGAPWCATFVSWCAEQANIPSSILKRSTAAGHGASYFNVNFYSGSSTLASSGDNDSYFQGYNYMPQKGDLFYTRSWSHVGLVVGVSGSYVITVEGNTNNNGSSQGNGVYKLTWRKIADLYFGVPNYTVTSAHTCNKGTYVFDEAAHPHYKCYECSLCGVVWRNTTEPTIVSTCSSCIPQKPTVTTDKSVYAAGSSVKISWNKVTGNEFYWINVYKDGTLIVNQSMEDNNSYTLQMAGVGVYNVLVSANNSAGTAGSGSCSFSVINDIKPGTPQISVSKTVCRTGDSITVTWQECSDATSYIYYVAEHPASYAYETYVKCDTIKGNTVTFSDLPNGKYRIFVHAINAVGTWSDQSNYVWMEFYNYDYLPAATAFLNGHMYVLYEGQMSWDLAQELCKMENGHLVTITSEAENELVQSMLVSGIGDGYWIGARNDNVNDYTIIGENYRWVTGEEFSYSDWAEGEPNACGDGAEIEHYGEIRKSMGNKWNDVKHTTKNGFILEVDISKYSPVATTTHGNSMYLLFDENISWTEAKTYSASIGGHLATISSAEEDAIVSELLQNGNREWYYLGAEGSTGEWIWNDGLAVPMNGTTANWGDIQGTEAEGPTGWGNYLMKYRSSGKWIGIQNFYLPNSNMSRIGFVCEIDNAVFTVNYDANGGDGAPSGQMKILNEELILSDTKPTRLGYTFMGWATDRTATIAVYQPGDSFTANADTVFYAVWAEGCEGDVHSYTDGICTACGEVDLDYVKPVVIPTLTLKAPTLEFKDMITINAMFTAENIDDVVEMGMITYTEKVDSWSVETASHVIPGTTYDASTGRYIAASQGIHAKYLGDTVYLACYAKLTDGSYVYTKLAGYSPVQYATSKLKGNDMPLKQLVVAMLNYGAAAQVHFGHNTDNLANATLTAEQIKLPEAYRSDMVSTVASPDAAKQGEFANNKGFSKRYPSISFEGAFCINYFFTPAYAPVDGITMYYWNAADYETAEVLSIENATGSFKMDGEGTAEYRGDIVGIAAKNLGEGVYVAAVYSDGTNTWTSGVLGYSIGAYCASQSTKGGTIADLAMATAVYGYQAKAYFG